TQDVDDVGLRGEVVNVARGYARNFLLPRRLAEIATPAKVAELEKREAQRARHEARSVEQGREIADLLPKTVLRFDVKAGPTGARSSYPSRSSASADTRSRSRCSRTCASR